MNPADVLHRLHGHQSRLLSHIDLSLALTASEPAIAQFPLARARWSAARMLREYQLFKHTEIFDPAILHGNASQSLTARRMRAACIAAGEQYNAYATHWSAQDIVAVWPDYRRAMRAMAERMRQHIEAERRDAAALISGDRWPRRPAWCEPPASLPTSSPARSRPAARADSRAR